MNNKKHIIKVATLKSWRSRWN